MLPLFYKIVYFSLKYAIIIWTIIYNLLDCIPSEIKCDNITEILDFRLPKLMKCKNTDKCVESMSECASEEGYEICNYMKCIL